MGLHEIKRRNRFPIRHDSLTFIPKRKEKKQEYEQEPTEQISSFITKSGLITFEPKNNTEQTNKKIIKRGPFTFIPKNNTEHSLKSKYKFISNIEI